MQRNIIISLGVITINSMGLLAQPLFAADRAPVGATLAAAGHGRHEGPLQRMIEALNLTADQKQQIMPIVKDSRQQAKAIRTDTTLSADQKKEKLKELHKAMVEKIAPILTPEQREKWAAMRKAGHHRKGGQNGAGL